MAPDADADTARSGRGVTDRERKLNLEIFTDSLWQMSLGERAALEGVLSQRKPTLSIEIGTAEGGSLERIALHSEEVHSFDLVAPQLEVAQEQHVTLHTGDSHELLPRELERFAADGRNVDFVLVDGDHSTEGVRQDIEDLLNSPAISSTVILIHDTTNPTVRAGLDQVRYAAWPKVDHVDLDFVPGYMFREVRLRHELWGGLGLVIVDATRLAYDSVPVVQERYYPAAPLFAVMQEVVVERESEPDREAGATGTESSEAEPSSAASALDEGVQRHIAALEEEILRITSVSAHHEALWREMMNSVSWKVTTPLRNVAAQARARLRD
jgi:hypothetical protein